MALLRTTSPATLLVVLLLVLVPLLHAISGFPVGDQHPLCSMNFTCTEEKCQCACERVDAPAEFIVKCPQEFENVRLQFAPGHYFRIDCRTANEEFQDMPIMDVGDVEKVAIKGCKIPPHTPLIEVFKRFGIRRLKALFLTTDDRDFPFRRDHFKGLDIRRLSLTTPGLTELPDDFFMEIRNITWLEIRNTKVQKIKNALTVLTQLKTFELPQNTMSELEEGAFENLKGLERLSLYSNQLKTIGQNDFRGLERVQMLDLLGNQIETVHPDAFVPLTNMTYLGLNKNRFRSLPEGLLRANPKLDEVKFMYNNISSLPSDLFANLPALRLINFAESEIESLPETMFENSTAITNITLNGNKISALASRTFDSLRFLLHLELQRNRIVELPRDVFRSCRQLRYLDLSNNLIEMLPGEIFQNQVNLDRLLLRNNFLKNFQPTTFDFTANLRILDVSNNQLMFQAESIFSDEVPQSPLKSLKSLETLNLRNNSLRHLHSDFSITMTWLRSLDLSYNNITFIQYQHLQFHGQGIEVDLRNNQISDVDFSAFEVIASAQMGPPMHPPTVLLDNNPMVCDCNVLHFARFLHRDLSVRGGDYLRIRADNLTCVQPERLQGRLLSSVDRSDLTCDFGTNHSCPAECSCALRPADQAVIVNCSSAGLTEVPQLPVATRMNYRYTILHLENNFLTSLPTADQLTGFNEVREIYAGGNNITEVLPENIPASLHSMDLTGNHIETISEATINKMNRTTMRLAGNRWACDCAMREVLSFMQLNYQRISDYDHLKCISGREISTLTTSDICPQELQFIIILSSILACLGIIIGLLAALYYKYQQELKIWMYWHNILPFLFNSDVLDSDKKYDAFISYSHKDEDFVTDLLMPELEQKRRFNLCIHRRDWTPGDFIPEQIARSVSESRRTLIVLSPHYVESVWGTMEFRTAHRSAMEDQVNRVIVIVYGKVDKEKLDPELKSYIDMNTYIEWGDPWFWERLHYALRTIQTKKEKSGNGLKKTPLKSSVDDKLELIHPSPISSPMNTPPAEHPMNYKQNGHVNGAFIINTNSKQSDV